MLSSCECNNTAYHRADTDDDDWSVVVVNSDDDGGGSSAAVAGDDRSDEDTDYERSIKSSAAVDEDERMDLKQSALLIRKKKLEEEPKGINRALGEGKSSDQQPASKDLKPSRSSLVMDLERSSDIEASFIHKSDGPIREGASSSKGGAKMVTPDCSRKRKRQQPGHDMDDDEEDSEFAPQSPLAAMGCVCDIETDCEGDSRGNTFFFSTCTKDDDQEPVDGVPDGSLEGCTNVCDYDSKLAIAESFLANVCPTHPHLKKNIVKHPAFKDYGTKSENAAIQVMNSMKFVVNTQDEQLKELKMIHPYKVGWRNNFRHFPDANDEFAFGSTIQCTHKTWQRQFPPPPEWKKAYSQTRYDDPDSFTGYEEISRETKGGIKKYQRLTRKFYQFIEMEDGTYQVIGVIRIQMRVHLWQKYLMIERAMKLDVVPPGYLLDPVERAWYIILRHGNCKKHMKGSKWKGVKIKGATGYLTLECSHLDHSWVGLDFLRIETKGENLRRVVTCFSSIKCSGEGCKYQIMTSCHEFPCHRPFYVLCPTCAP